MYLLSLTRPLIRLALKGGAIASSNAANSDLTADALTLQNISNQMNYNPDTVSTSGGAQDGNFVNKRLGYRISEPFCRLQRRKCSGMPM